MNKIFRNTILLLGIFSVIGFFGAEKVFAKPDPGTITGPSYTLGYTTEDKKSVGGTISGTPINFKFYKYEGSMYGGYYYFAQDPKPEYPYFEIMVTKINTSTSETATLYKYFETDPTESWPVIINSYTPPAGTPTSPGGSTPGGSTPGGTTPTNEYADLDPGASTGPITKPTWKTVFAGDECDSYDCWIGKVWNWAMAIMVPLSVLILSAAGVIYTISEGDSKRIDLAKKMIMGVVSGVGLLVLSRVLITVILGEKVAEPWLKIFL